MTEHDIQNSQLALALRMGLKPNDPILAALWPQDGNIIHVLRTNPPLSAETIFSPVSIKDAHGKDEKTCFFSRPEFMKILPEIMMELRDRGVELTAEHFTKTITGAKSAIMFASECKNLSVIMNPELWPGKPNDIEKLYWSINIPDRNGYELDDLKRQAARAGGIRLREDILEEAGVSLQDIKTACKSGKIGDIAAKIQAGGLTLEKGDLFLAKVWTDKETWQNYESIHRALAAAGDPMRFDDFQIHVKKPGTTLERTVQEQGVEEELFAPAVSAEKWIGHAGELLELVSARYISKEKKDKNKIYPGKIFSRLADLEYGERFQNYAPMTLEETTAPVAAPPNLKDAFDGKTPKHTVPAPSPLGIATLWSHMDQLKEDLEDAGTPLTPDHLKAVCGYGAETGLIAGARAGKIVEIMEIYRDSGQFISQEELFKNNDFHESALSLMKDQDIKNIVFDPQYWVGNPKAMKALHDKLEISLKGKIPIDDILKRLNRASVIQRAGAMDMSRFFPDGPAV